jgi:HEAT repeat protein
MFSAKLELYFAPGGIMDRSRPLSALLLSLAVFLGCAVTVGAQQQATPEQLINGLSDPDPIIRGESLRGMEALPTDVVVPKVIVALQTADKDVAIRLVKVLVEHPHPSEIEPLLALAKKYGGFGSEVFAVLGPDGTRALMAAAAKNCDTDVGEKSFLNWSGETASLGGAQARAILREQTQAENPCTRQAALWGLAVLPAFDSSYSQEMQQSVEAIVARLADKNEKVVSTAEQILKPETSSSRYRREALEDYAVQPLLKFFQAQTDAALRFRALNLLALYGDSSVQELMTSLADDPNTDIKKIATSYAPPQEEEDRIHYSEAPQSGITSPEKSAEIKRLHHSTKTLDRVAAANQMGASGDVLYTAGLIELLKDPTIRVRAAAADGLSALNGYFEDAAVRWAGNREDSASALLALFDDPSAKVRATAVKAYASLFPDYPSSEDMKEDHAQILAKLSALANDTNPKVAHEAAIAYAKFLWPEDLKQAVELLRHPNSDVRRAVAGTIAHSQLPEGVKPLVALLKDPDPAVRCDAGRDLWVMIVIGQEDNKDALEAQLEAQPLAEALNDSAITKDQIIDLLVASNDPNATKIISEALTTYHMSSMESLLRILGRKKNPNTTTFLLTVLTSGTTPNNWNALTALLNTHDPAIADPILAYAQTPAGAWVDQERVLLELHDSRLVPLLLTRLKDEHEDVRVRVATELAAFKDTRIVPALLPVLKDEAWAVQYAAAGALGKLGDARAIAPLIAMLEYNPGAAALALGDLKATEALPKLSQLLSNSKTHNRNEIAAGIAKMSGPQAAAALASAVEHDRNMDCNLMTELARTLGNIQDPSVVPALQKINLDGWGPKGCTSARLVAAQALAQRGARPLPESKQNALVP